MHVYVEPTITGYWRVSHDVRFPKFPRFQVPMVCKDGFSFTRAEASRVLDAIENEWGVSRYNVRFNVY
jgi:hypothetical protein